MSATDLTADERLISDIMRAELHDRFHDKKVTRKAVADVVASFIGCDADDIKVSYKRETGQFFIDIHA